MDALEDRQLVILVQATGDPRAFETLVRRHHSAAIAFLGTLGADRATAHDAAQRALLKAHQKIDTFAFKAAFKTWLFKIAYREYAQLRRTARANTRLAQRSETPQDEPVGPDRGGGPIDAKLDLEAALRRLSEPERTAVLLCDAYGFSHAEAAETMSKPLGTIKTYVRRARARLRDLLTVEAIS